MGNITVKHPLICLVAVMSFAALSSEVGQKNINHTASSSTQAYCEYTRSGEADRGRESTAEQGEPVLRQSKDDSGGQVSQFDN